MSLIVGTLRTKWKRLDLRGRRGKSAKRTQCKLTLTLSSWGKSRKGRFLLHCCQGKKVPRAAGMLMLTPFPLRCLFSPCSVKGLFQLFWLQFVWFTKTCGIQGMQPFTLFLEVFILQHTHILIRFCHLSCLRWRQSFPGTFPMLLSIISILPGRTGGTGRPICSLIVHFKKLFKHTFF